MEIMKKYTDKFCNSFDRLQYIRIERLSCPYVFVRFFLAFV